MIIKRDNSAKEEKQIENIRCNAKLRRRNKEEINKNTNYKKKGERNKEGSKCKEKESKKPEKTNKREN